MRLTTVNNPEHGRKAAPEVSPQSEIETPHQDDFRLPARDATQFEAECGGPCYWLKQESPDDGDQLILLDRDSWLALARHIVSVLGEDV